MAVEGGSRSLRGEFVFFYGIVPQRVWFSGFGLYFIRWKHGAIRVVEECRGIGMAWANLVYGGQFAPQS